MFKLCIFLAVLAVAFAAPAPAPAPGILAPAIATFPAAPIVTASSSQYVSRNYNTLAAAPFAAAPLHAAPLAYAAAPIGYGTHAVAPAITAYAAPVIL